MLYNTYDGQSCSVARALEVIGERWTILILRDAFLGIRRFDDFQRSLGIARNVLNARLQRLIEAGVLERRLYQERPDRHEYFLTEKGLDLWPVLVALIGWGDRHCAGPEGPPAVIVHEDCGGRVNDRRICERCDAELGPRDAKLLEGAAATEFIAAA